jgi:hypothetical protein
MGDYLEQARLLVEKIQKIVGIFRYRRSETVTAVLAVLCFSAATLGLDNEFVKQLLPSSYLEVIRSF